MESWNQTLVKLQFAGSRLQDLGGSTAPKPAMEERSEMYKKEEEFTGQQTC